jgi:transposase
VEPTGRYSTLVVQQATTAGRQVLQAQPKRAQHFLASIQDRLKTDGLDSRGLALYGLNRVLPPFRLKSDVIERLDQLRTARKGLAGSLMRLRQQAQELPHAARFLAATQRDLEARCRELDQEIATILADKTEFPMTQKLQQVPGIGPVVAAAVLSCLTTKQFTHPDQFVAYCGLAISRRQSGKQEGVGRLSKQGDGELRRLLYLAARSNLLCRSSPFKTQYARERAKGLEPTAALCAVARKLARLCWSMWKHQSTYDPDRVHQQPEKYGGREAHGATALPEHATLADPAALPATQPASGRRVLRVRNAPQGKAASDREKSP